MEMSVIEHQLDDIFRSGGGRKCLARIALLSEAVADCLVCKLSRPLA